MTDNKRYDGSEPDMIGAAVYARFPNLLNPVSEVFTRLFSIARTYTAEQKYDITGRTFTSISQLLIEYLRLRADNLQMPTVSQAQFFGPTELSFDAVLTAQLEQLSELYKFSISRRDQEICRQIIACHRIIALASIDINPFFIHPGENPTTSFILGYLDSLTTQAGTHGLDDACLAGIRALSDIGSSLVRSNYYLNFTSAMDAIGKAATLGTLRSNQVLTGEAVSAISGMVLSCLTNPFMVRTTFSRSRALLEEISKTQLRALGRVGALDQSVQNTLGPFLAVTSRTGLATWFEATGNRILEALSQQELESAEAAMDVFETLSDQLWLHLSNIGEAAASTESFALFFVDSNVREIGKMQIFMYRYVSKHLSVSQPEDEKTARNEWQFERFETELLRDLDWLIGAIYWRIYKALPTPVRSNLVWSFFETLQELGISALEADLSDQTETAIDHLASLVKAMLDKPLQAPYGAGRAAARIARIGMVALQAEDEKIVVKSLTRLAELHAQFLQKFPEDEELQTSLLRGVDEIAGELDEGAPSLDEVEIHFARSVTPDAAKRYIERLHAWLRRRRH